jgi:hypothetical protein
MSAMPLPVAFQGGAPPIFRPPPNVPPPNFGNNIAPALSKPMLQSIPPNPLPVNVNNLNNPVNFSGNNGNSTFNGNPAFNVNPGLFPRPFFPPPSQLQMQPNPNFVSQNAQNVTTNPVIQNINFPPQPRGPPAPTIPPPSNPTGVVIGDPNNDVSCWTDHTSEEGRKYWYNRVSLVSTYDKPFCLKTPEERSIPPCPWKEYTADGKKYYSNGTESTFLIKLFKFKIK